MPPPESKLELTAEERDILKRWIAEGAEYKPHWSLQPIISPPPPATHQAQSRSSAMKWTGSSRPGSKKRAST